MTRPLMGKVTAIIVVGAVVVAGLVAAVVALVVDDGLGSGTAEGPSAAEVLDDLAEVAAEQDAPDGGSVHHARFETLERSVASADDDVFQWAQSVEWETWTAPDGSGRRRVVAHPPTFPSPEDEQAWIDLGRPLPVETVDEVVTGGPPPPDVTSLPDGTDQLRDELLGRADGGGAPEGDALFSAVGTVLRAPDAPPAVRAAAFRVLGSVRGIELSDESIDPAGRQGVRIDLRDPAQPGVVRWSMTFDAATSELLAERAPFRDGEVITVWRSIGLVDEVPPATPSE